MRCAPNGASTASPRDSDADTGSDADTTALMRTPRWIAPLLAPLLTALLAAGCAAGGGVPTGTAGDRPGSPPATGSGSGVPTIAAPATAAAPTVAGVPVTPSAAPTELLVRYGRQGGIAGVVEELTIRQDGSFSLTERRRPAPRTGRLEPDELASVRQVLRDSGFADIPTVNPGPDGADLFTYRVAHGGREVLAEDGGVPDRLDPVLALLARLLARYQ